LELDDRVEAYSRYAAGVSREMRGEPREALEEYYKSALADPANEQLVIEVSRRLLRGRRPEQATELLKRAAGSPDASGIVHAMLGAAYSQMGKNELAIASCKKAIVLDPDEFASHQNLFQIYFEAAKFKEALQVLDQAARVKDTDGIFLISLADQYSRYLQLRPTEKIQVQPKVIAVLDRVSKTKPTDPRIMIKLADGFKASGETKRAEEVYREILKREPNMPTIREKLAELYIRAGDNAKAEAELKKIASDRPTNPQVWFIMGSLLSEQGKFTNAIEYFERAIRLDPTLDAAYFELTSVFLSLDQPEKALKLLEKGRAVLGDGFAIQFYAGLAHSRAKNYPEAVKAMTAAELIAKTSETNRLTPQFYFQLGATHERNKDYGTSEKFFRKCLELSPDFAEALNYLGYMWAERGTNLDEAQRFIARALKAEPDNAAFLDSMAWVLFQKGKFKDALTFMDRAVKLIKEPDATLYDHLGDIHSKLGKKDKAREAWMKAIEIEKLPEVQKKLDALGPPDS
jgi:tetratricopeptide (TPR) repeat protein